MIKARLLFFLCRVDAGLVDMSDGVVRVKARTREEFEREVAPLVAALMTMHAVPVDAKLGRVVVPESSAGRSFEFYFKEATECGRWKVRDLIEWWGLGKAWLEKNPEHEFAYVMGGRLNEVIVRDYVAADEPVVFMRKGRQVGMLPLGASGELEEEILGSFR